MKLTKEQNHLVVPALVSLGVTLVGLTAFTLFIRHDLTLFVAGLALYAVFSKSRFWLKFCFLALVLTSAFDGFWLIISYNRNTPDCTIHNLNLLARLKQNALPAGLFQFPSEFAFNFDSDRTFSKLEHLMKKLTARWDRNQEPVDIFNLDNNDVKFTTDDGDIEIKIETIPDENNLSIDEVLPSVEEPVTINEESTLNTRRNHHKHHNNHHKHHNNYPTSRKHEHDHPHTVHHSHQHKQHQRETDNTPQNINQINTKSSIPVSEPTSHMPTNPEFDSNCHKHFSFFTVAWYLTIFEIPIKLSVGILCSVLSTMLKNQANKKDEEKEELEKESYLVMSSDQLKSNQHPRIQSHTLPEEMVARWESNVN